MSSRNAKNKIVIKSKNEFDRREKNKNKLYNECTNCRKKLYKSVFQLNGGTQKEN